jgi:hypothetical protein
MKKYVIILSLLFIISGCSRQTELFNHQGLPFTENLKTITIKELDKTYPQYLRNKSRIRIQGTIKYQCKIRGLWAFIDDTTGLIFVDFAPTTPSISLSTHQYSYPIIIEGLLTPDETVLNNYHIIPTGYEFIRD